MANDNIAIRATSHIVTLMIFIIYNCAPITLSLLSGGGHHRFYALCMYCIIINIMHNFVVQDILLQFWMECHETQWDYEEA